MQAVSRRALASVPEKRGRPEGALGTRAGSGATREHSEGREPFCARDEKRNERSE